MYVIHFAPCHRHSLVLNITPDPLILKNHALMCLSGLFSSESLKVNVVNLEYQM